MSLDLKTLGLGALGWVVAVSSAFAQTPKAPDLNGLSAPTAENSALDSELFFQLLLGELNVTGGEPGAAYSIILDAARKTRDPKLYERAIRVALQARSGEPALQAARAWKQALPASREANRYVLQLLLGLNRLGETLEPLKSEIATSAAAERAASIAAVPGYFARASDKKAATSLVEQALAPYLDSAQYGAAAWSAIGQMRMNNGDSVGALDAAAKAQAADPASDGAVSIALPLISAKALQAEQLVRKYLQANAGTSAGAAATASMEVRMDYVRVLLDAQRYAEAAEQLRIVTTDKPEHPQAWLIKGTLELQDKKIDAAEKSFKRHIEISQSSSAAESNRGLVQAYLSMSQIAEQRKDFAQAESWLKRIDNADDMIIAQSRRAAILAKQGKLDDARKLLRNLPEKTPEDARQKVMAEVQLLRDNKQYKSAYELVAEKAKASEGDHELLYDKAMLAEKLGRLDEMELLLRGVIAVKPDFQHAYNALGYSLAERKLRLPEARALILKALELAPNDPFITDSLGWVEFRSGNLPEALRILQGAFESKPDAEIAAHLGEVLWASGKREQALTVWREGVTLNAENETLVETLKRLRVKP
jgi:tetratricopeptide (TPR) repeat protein